MVRPSRYIVCDNENKGIGNFREENGGKRVRCDLANYTRTSRELASRRKGVTGVGTIFVSLEGAHPGWSRR